MIQILKFPECHQSRQFLRTADAPEDDEVIECILYGLVWDVLLRDVFVFGCVDQVEDADPSHLVQVCLLVRAHFLKTVEYSCCQLSVVADEGVVNEAEQGIECHLFSVFVTCQFMDALLFDVFKAPINVVNSHFHSVFHISARIVDYVLLVTWVVDCPCQPIGVLFPLFKCQLPTGNYQSVVELE